MTITTYGQNSRVTTSQYVYTTGLGPHAVSVDSADGSPPISGPHGLVVHSTDGQPFIAEEMVLNLGTQLRGTQGFAP